jgi:hypothetical protein
VHCPKHNTWLFARRPRLKGQSPLHPWANVWSSRPQWAEAFEYRYVAELAMSANGFSPDSFAQPSVPWAEFERDLEEALGPDDDTTGPFATDSPTSVILSFDFAKLRHDVIETMQMAPPIQRLDDRDIICYPWQKPVWIAARIACVVIAVECLRLVEGRAPAFPTVAPLVRNSGCADSLNVSGRSSRST